MGTLRVGIVGAGGIAQMQHFVDCCATGAEPITPARQGLVCNRIFAAIYQSGAEGGRQVLLP